MRLRLGRKGPRTLYRFVRAEWMSNGRFVRFTGADNEGKYIEVDFFETHVLRRLLNIDMTQLHPDTQLVYDSSQGWTTGPKRKIAPTEGD